MEKEIFINYTKMSCDEIKVLVDEQIKNLENKLNGSINELEKNNKGLLFWDCKMILRNISMACSKIIRKYQSGLTETENIRYNYISNVINESEGNWKNMNDIKNTFSKITTKCVNNNEELKDINLSEIIKEEYYPKIAKLLNITVSECKINIKAIEKNVIFCCKPVRGGLAMYISNDGYYLIFTSGINPDKALEEFKKGRRNGTLEKNSILKFTCPKCWNEWEEKTEQLPKDLNTLDISCPKCNSSMKFVNPNND